ncbi:MAG: hypothetical protein VR69_04825 [Peptococcaceae bacterium BRH_c4b]|nr:MAG: hypothetical protein VR69_04825 [Peptococcaceae bacterium BRH_c4b]
MNPFDRVLMVVYALITTILLVFSVLLLVGWQLLASILLDIYSRPFFIETIFVLIGLYILVGLRFIWFGIRPAAKQAVVSDGKLGQVRIALTAIEDLVDKIVSQNSGIKEVKSKVVRVPEGVGINVKASVTPDVQIPQISEIIQQQVRESVLEVTGMPVQDVRILVNSITAHKPRVE